jgi:hypothetical protein
LNVRAGNGTNFPIKRKFERDDIVVKKGQQGVWLEIGNDAAWIHSDICDPNVKGELNSF